jgi:Fe-S-cluster containining protein
MFSRLKDLYQFVDNTVEEIKNQHPEQIRCKPGCADCCHAVFDISFIEAAYLADFLSNHKDLVKSQQEHAQKAAVAFETLLKEDADLAKARIRCPLLGEDDLCLGHEVRPVNCRTYGTPTVINGEAHVCGTSEFDNNKQYPTIDLEPLQKSLCEYSAQLVGEDFGKRRFPIAWVFLKTDFFRPPVAE